MLDALIEKKAEGNSDEAISLKELVDMMSIQWDTSKPIILFNMR